MDVVIVWDILRGIGTGVAAALVGYIKAMPDGDKLDWKKYTPTLIIGAAAGIVASLMGVDLTTATNIIAGFGAVTLVNSLWVAFEKKFVRTTAKVKK